MPAHSRHAILRAALWMGGALLSFLAMAVAGRELSAELDTFGILFFRSLVGLVVVSLLLTRSGWHQISARRLKLQIGRNVAHFVGQFGWFYGVALIPLAEVFAIEFTTPAWTALLAALILGERLTRPRLAAVALGLAGILVILRPGAAVIEPAALAVLIGAAAYGLAYVLTKKLSDTETPLAIVFYMTAVQLPLALVPSALDWVTPSPALWPWLLLVGVAGLSAHYCLTRALSLADATVVVPFDFLRLPLALLVGLLLYAETVDPLVLAGAGLIVLGNYINIRAERRRAVPKPGLGTVRT